MNETDSKEEIASPLQRGVKCPHCGGETGYQYKLHIHGVQYYGWDGDPENAHFSDSGGRAFKETCSDCGKGI